MSDFHHKKRFGQHFLNDKNIVRKIVREAGITDGDKVWEIGPGQGVLTDELLAAGAELTVFEIDYNLWDELTDKYGSKIKLIKGDVLRVDWSELLADNIKIVANLPYQITSPFLFKVCEYYQHFSSVTVMIQDEVARRVDASVGSKDYSLLSLRMSHFFVSKYLFKVPPHLFTPPPRVNSAVIRLTPKDDIVILDNMDLYWKLIKTAFGKRRKMLRKNLLAILTKEQVARLQTEFGFDLTSRGETFGEKEFISLYHAVTSIL